MMTTKANQLLQEHCTAWQMDMIEVEQAGSVDVNTKNSRLALVEVIEGVVTVMDGDREIAKGSIDFRLTPIQVGSLSLIFDGAGKARVIYK